MVTPYLWDGVWNNKMTNQNMNAGMYEEDMETLVEHASALKRRNYGNTIFLRTAHNFYINHLCGADCQFCAWGRDSQIDNAVRDGLLEENRNSLRSSINLSNQYNSDLEIILNNEWINNRKIQRIWEYTRDVPQNIPFGIQPGLLRNRQQADKFRDLEAAYICNDLETSPSYFPFICTTHTIQDKLRSLQFAREAGLKIWSGFCMGMGESRGQRIEAMRTLQHIDVEGVILNFFYDVPGIPLHGEVEPLSSEEKLKTIALMRIAFPDKYIVLGNGRKHHLGDLRERAYEIVSGIYIGSFLNHPKRSVMEDLEIIEKLGLEIRRKDHIWKDPVKH